LASSKKRQAIKGTKKAIKTQQLITKINQCDYQLAVVQHVLGVDDLHISSDALKGIVENISKVRSFLQTLDAPHPRKFG